MVELATGKLLAPEQGRLHKVTRSTGIALPDPTEPEHWGVHALLEHYEADIADFVWKWVARSLWGLPSQEFLLFVGKSQWGGEGKTTVKETMLKALGGYAATFSETMMKQRREGGPTPEVQPAVERRLLISEECAGWKIDAERFKLVTGGGNASIPVEPKFEAQQSLPVTASLILMANQPPRLPKDDALLKRLRYVELRKPPNVNKDLRDLHKTDPTFVPHVLRRLIREAATFAPTGSAPGLSDLDITQYPEMETITRAKIADLLGALYTWVRGAVLQQEGGNLGREILWGAWARVHGETPEADKIEGETQESLRAVMFQLYNTRMSTVRVSAGVVKGWRGLVLKDLARCSQCEAVVPSEGVKDVDGRGATCKACRGEDVDATPPGATPGGDVQGGLDGMPAEQQAHPVTLDSLIETRLADLDAVANADLGPYAQVVDVSRSRPAQHATVLRSFLTAVRRDPHRADVQFMDPDYPTWFLLTVDSMIEERLAAGVPAAAMVEAWPRILYESHNMAQRAKTETGAQVRVDVKAHLRQRILGDLLPGITG